MEQQPGNDSLNIAESIKNNVRLYMNQRQKEPEYPESSQLGYTKEEELAGAQALLDSFEGIPIAERHLKVLNKGVLSLFYKKAQTLPFLSAALEYNVTMKSYKEMIALIEKAIAKRDFIELGVKFKPQLFPNLYKLLQSLKENKDYSLIQEIAKEGIRVNERLIEERIRDPEQAKKRLRLFKIIAMSAAPADAFIDLYLIFGEQQF